MYTVRAHVHTHTHTHMHSHKQVVNNAKSSLLVKALGKVTGKALHMCGDVSCMQLGYAAILRLGWQSAALLGLCLIAAPNIVLVVLQCMWQRRMACRLEHSMDSAGKQSVHGFSEGDESCTSLSVAHGQGFSNFGHSHSPFQAHTPVMRYRKSLFFNRAVELPSAPALYGMSAASNAEQGWLHED